MRTAKNIVHSNRLYPLQNGLAQVRYVGLKFPESQWAGLMDEAPAHVTKITEIGHIFVEAEGIGELYDIERQMLNMAKQHGAHIVLIDFIKNYELEGTWVNQPNSGIHIYGRCQRFEI